jgi:O-methyltransferase
MPLEGDTIECGVYHGGVSGLIASMIAGWKKTHFVCDSFIGLPDRGVYDNHHKRGDFADTSCPQIREGLSRLGVAPWTYIAEGWFSDTLSNLPADKFCFAHIDCDLYDSTLQCLSYIYPRLSSGGWMVIDDYTWEHTEGVKQAVSHFFADKPETVNILCGNAAGIQKV